MSLLVRLLVMFAVMLTATYADDCVTKRYGRETSYTNTDGYPIPEGNTSLNVPSSCPSEENPVGAQYKVCNASPGCPTPEINDPPSGQISPIAANCKCGDCVAEVTGWCGS